MQECLLCEPFLRSHCLNSSLERAAWHLIPQFKIQYLSFYRHHKKFLFTIAIYTSINLRKHTCFWRFNLNTTRFLFLLHLSKWDTVPWTRCSKYNEFIGTIFDVLVSPRSFRNSESTHIHQFSLHLQKGIDEQW